MNEPPLRWARIPREVLNIDASLDSGQCFRWRRGEGGTWSGVVGDAAVVLRPEPDGFAWQTYPEPDRWQLLERYFALDVPLTALYRDWIEAEPRIAPSIRSYAGMRILRQDAEEALFAFLCASCNTIVKIRRTVSALAARYGRPIATVRGEALYAFPGAADIAGACERELRGDLWGYRAPTLIAVARHAVAQGPGWLERLRTAPYLAARAELAALRGIGAKLADCISLFALGHDEACPVDTHVRQIAVRLFRPDLHGRSLTPAVYEALADEYRRRFGAYAGWAQQYLFFGELPQGRFDSAADPPLAPACSEGAPN